YLLVATSRSWMHYRTPQNGNNEYSIAELASIGSRVFEILAWLQGFVIVLLTPAFVAGSIAEDRQRKVLTYLLASPLTGAEILLGKLAARLINLFMLIALALPVLSIAMFLGGVEPEHVWLYCGASFSSLYFLAGACIFISTFSARPRDAIVRAYLFVLVWLLLPLLEQMIVSAPRGSSLAPLSSLLIDARPLTSWILNSSPSSLLFVGSLILSGSLLEAVLWMIILQLLYSTIALWWATVRLRPVEKGSRLRGFRWMGGSGVKQPRRFFPRRPCGDAPMLWKECSATLAGASLFRMIALFALAAAAVGGLGYWVVVMGVPAFLEMLTYGYGLTKPSSDRDALNVAVRIFTAVLYILGGLLLAASAATGITMEREKDTWTSLTSTPLESGEIIQAKILGAFWRVRGLLTALLFVWLVGLFCGAVHPLGFLATITLASTCLVSVAVLGTYFSLRSKSSARAISATIVTLIILSGGYMMCCIPVWPGPESIIQIAGCTPVIVPYALLSFSEVADLLHRHAYGLSSALVIETGLLTVAIYGFLALGLFHLCLGRFEIEVDRPRRDFPGYRGKSGARGAVLDDEDDALFSAKDRLVKKRIEQPLEPEIAEQPDPSRDPASQRRELSSENLEDL
ncbi:MAG TPA: ABC transporter permease, partial [Isosphaeraceae bacterium]|nr:ABC transporter permease [Isosphaeraceae bacterium]